MAHDTRPQVAQSFHCSLVFGSVLLKPISLRWVGKPSRSVGVFGWLFSFSELMRTSCASWLPQASSRALSEARSVASPTDGRADGRALTDAAVTSAAPNDKSGQARAGAGAGEGKSPFYQVLWRCCQRRDGGAAAAIRHG